jgi:hypothetical protein
MRSSGQQGPSVRTLLALVLLLAALLIVGPLATLASAQYVDMPSIDQCVSDGEVIVKTNYDGTKVYWVCNIRLTAEGKIHRWWSVKVDGPFKSVNKASARSDSYTRLNVLIAKGHGNGFGLVSYQLYSGDAASTLFRQIDVRLLVKNRTTGGTCMDTGWQGPSGAASHTTIVRVRDLPTTCGGQGTMKRSATVASTPPRGTNGSPPVGSTRAWYSSPRASPAAVAAPGATI